MTVTAQKGEYRAQARAGITDRSLPSRRRNGGEALSSDAAAGAKNVRGFSIRQGTLPCKWPLPINNLEENEGSESTLLGPVLMLIRACAPPHPGALALSNRPGANVGVPDRVLHAIDRHKAAPPLGCVAERDGCV